MTMQFAFFSKSCGTPLSGVAIISLKTLVESDNRSCAVSAANRTTDEQSDNAIANLRIIDLSTKDSNPGSNTQVCEGLQNHDRFDVDELANAPGSEFAPVPGRLYAAEGQACVRSYHAVDEDHSSVDLIDEALLLDGVAGPGAGSESEASIVSQADGLFDSFGTHQYGD